MVKYIDANLLKAEFTGNFTKAYATPLIKTIIDQLPTADVQEVKHGRWIYHGEAAVCCNCGQLTEDRCIKGNCSSGYYTTVPKYCSNCGAKMDGVDELRND